MPTLTFETLPETTLETRPVEVAEFGSENDQPFTVNVRGLTVAEWTLLLRRAFETNMANGQLSLKDDYDEVCLVAAMCSLDDEGRPVFGRSRAEAEEFLRNLPSEYRPALRRIHGQALALSNHRRDLNEAVEAAEKN